MSKKSAIEILRGKGWETDGGEVFSETGFGYRVVVGSALYPELVHEGVVGGAEPVRECITEADLEALVEATNAKREENGEGPLFAAPQQRAAEAPESDEAAWRVNEETWHAFSTEEVRRILWALRSMVGLPWNAGLLNDLIVKAENYIEAATGEMA